MNTKRVHICYITRPVQFTSIDGSLHDDNDNRVGLWMATVNLNTEETKLGEIGHSGLRQTKDEAHYKCLELARAARKTIEALGGEAYIDDAEGRLCYSSETYAYYLDKRNAKEEARAEAARINEQIRLLKANKAALLAA
jgi:hypothetical protein